jgi:hypothetical protein
MAQAVHAERTMREWHAEEGRLLEALPRRADILNDDILAGFQVARSQIYGNDLDNAGATV